MSRTKRRDGRIKDVANLRYVRPRVCAFCAYFGTNKDGDMWHCKRKGGPHGDMINDDQYLTTCSRYKPDVTLDDIVNAKEALRAKH